MVSKNQIKLIISLHQKKHRLANGMFLAEGEKVIKELLDSEFILESLYSTDLSFESVAKESFFNVSEADLKKMSALTTPNNCLAVFRIPVSKTVDHKDLILVLDDIRDPGNLGTIIRLCDWFGIKELVCSKETVDLYNPKVVQSSMGSLTRVNINYVDLEDFISKSTSPIFGTFMDGQNIYKATLPTEGLIVMGNEANGISEKIEKLIQNRIAIPRFGNLQKTESLNVATATAIILSEFKRN